MAQWLVSDRCEGWRVEIWISSSGCALGNVAFVGKTLNSYSKETVTVTLSTKVNF